MVAARPDVAMYAGQILTLQRENAELRARAEAAEARIAAAALEIKPDEGAGTYECDEDEGFATGWNVALASVRAALTVEEPTRRRDLSPGRLCPLHSMPRLRLENGRLGNCQGCRDDIAKTIAVGESSPDQDTPCATCGGFGMVVNVPYDHRSMHRWVPCPSCAPTEPGDAT